jgi:uncharacterized protein (DUF362 family)
VAALHRCFDYNDVMGMKDEVWPSSPFFRGKKVFIKPNLVVPISKWERASTTRLELVEMAVECLKDEGCNSIVIGDCGFKNQWAETIKSSGYESLLKRYGVQLIGLQEAENYHKFSLIRFDNKGDYLSLFGAKFSDYVLDCDYIVNLPKLKVHKMALVTGAIKNMMGCMTNKGNMHPRGDINILHKRLHDLYFLIRDRVKLCIMDGVEGSEYSEHYGLVKRANAILVSDDMWDMDCCAAHIMGIYPQKVPYLNLIQRDLQQDFPNMNCLCEFEKPVGWC